MTDAPAISPYWVLEGSTASRMRWIAKAPYVRGLRWWRGLPLDRTLVPKRLSASLEPLRPGASDHGPFIPPFFNVNPPLFVDRMITVMIDEGASNIEAVSVDLHDPDNGAVHTNYSAVNLLGLIHAADLSKSIYTAHPGGAKIDVDFNRLVIDPDKARGELIFRLAESVNVILVHDRLKRR